MLIELDDKMPDTHTAYSTVPHIQGGAVNNHNV